MPASMKPLYQGENDVASRIPADVARRHGIREFYIDMPDICFIQLGSHFRINK